MAADLNVSEPAPATPVDISLGSQLTVELVEDPVQDLKWVYGPTPSPSFEVIDENKRHPDPSIENRRFVFKAAVLGLASLTFTYGPYTKELAEPQRSVTFQFNVVLV
jgi:hypothetical protein